MFWYNEEVSALEKKIVSPKTEKLRVLFYGSSSIRLWPGLEEAFYDFEVENQAFGGSTLAACCWFFNRLIPQYNPDILIFYAGDNDLGDGRHPEEVFFFFKSLMTLVQENFGAIPVAFISIKPSLSRMHLLSSIEYTNKIVKEEIEAHYPNCTFVNVFDSMQEINKKSRQLFEEDGLHLSEAGYQLWQKVLKQSFLKQFI